MQKESSAGLRQLLDHTEKHVRALKKLGEPTGQWGTILVHLMTAKFDNITKREWENKASAREVATYKQFIDFTTDRCVMLETLLLDKSKSAKLQSNDPKSNYANKKSVAAVTAEAKPDECLACNQGKHRLYHCATFLNLTPQARGKEVKRLKLCFNCFKGGHSVETCNSSTCRLCHKKHNTLLHIPTSVGTEHGSNNRTTTIESQTSTEAPSTSVAHHAVRLSDRGLLATAIINIQDNSGGVRECRAFLDPGSQSNFMTKELCERLGLTQRKNHMQIRGIDKVQTATFTETHATIRSKFNAFKSKLTFSILPEITVNLPLSEINKKHLQIPETIILADPSFHTPGKIDVLLGSAIFWELLCVGQIKLGKNQPIAQKTKLGWIIAGPLGLERAPESSVASVSIVSSTIAIETQLERFWQIEEGNRPSELSESDKICEEEFTLTHKRDAEGRFKVRLPLCDSVNRLGDSREIATKRLRCMEWKFAKSPELKQQYTLFMQEYEVSKHMTEVPNQEESGIITYLPHQAVLKPDSSTTKLRVVFDASCPTSSGVSLNNILRIGPTIQRDLLSIILRFRRHQFAITADIKQMYRQVLVQEDQHDLQRILWRQEPGEPIQEYRLNTLTYGLSSAPFLAIRCLYQVSIENQDRYPEASRIIRDDFYVDDLLSGGDDINTLRRLKDELTEILQSAGFCLHKWNTNEPTILDASSDVQALPRCDEIKTLGIGWNTTDDYLQYRTRAIEGGQRATKRTVLSIIAQLYDPLGLMGPVIIRAKIILQQLWQSKIGWDESLPQDLYTTWRQYQEQMKEMELISIPRHVMCKEPQTIELHGFCDASETAYGACIFIRSTNFAGDIVARLLCAKSRVAPLKSITLPRLELCGALLLVKLGETVRQALAIKFDHIQYWSDSTITLAWIKHHPGELQTFVANRIATIQRTAPDVQWSHVRSKDNPADIISRGTTPRNLKTSFLWWTGPPWLTQGRQDWPIESGSSIPEIPELKKQVVAYHGVPLDTNLFARFSSLFQLKRTVAYCLRFKANACAKAKRRTGPLSVEELNRAMVSLTRVAQLNEFATEIADLQTKREISRRSKLLPLNPFLDETGLLRVGGRLRHADADHAKRHPIILPAKHPLTDLIIRDSHLKQMHMGSQGLLAHLRSSHLELVSDLTTVAFLSALKRFIARRGRCANLFSDNGTNFIGANNELQALSNMLRKDRENIERFLADQSVQWHFIPAQSPHMGGLWEAV
ncbi:uncharacterized protein, partial [Mycetomoellerius zeteki]|uniref:uncharacterized protein n=1 Tax=Mycetomoellerius zeteki TaxID=64791 RepID=UPI00084E818C